MAAQGNGARLEGPGKNLALLSWPSPVEAYKWFVLAESHGDKNGQNVHNALIKSMTPDQPENWPQVSPIKE